MRRKGEDLRGFERREICCLCGKRKDQVAKLIVGLDGAVCTACIDLCCDILQRDHPVPVESPPAPTDLALRVAKANRSLPQAGLVTAHSGNVSGLDRQTGLVYIKPSGIDYENLTGSQVVAVDLRTRTPLENQLKPSVDLPQHLFLYRNMPEIGGVVHTHSNYATAFAACGMAIPCVLTAVADEFGGEIPCMPYVDNQGDAIGEAILTHRGRGPAILLGSHGVFTWGPTPEAALKAAIMVEDTAKTIWLSLQIGKPTPFPPEEITKWWDRYHTTYGQ